MTSQEALADEYFRVTLNIVDEQGALISQEVKNIHFPDAVNQTQSAVFDNILTFSATLDFYNYQQRTAASGNGVEGFYTAFSYNVVFNQQQYKNETESKCYIHTFETFWPSHPEPEVNEIRRYFTSTGGEEVGDYWGPRRLTDHQYGGRPYDRRTYTDFEIAITLTKRNRDLTYLPVRNNQGIIVRHYETNIIFRDE